MTEKGGWFKAMRGGKTGFDKLWGYADKLGAPVNKVTNKIGSEAFWPTSIDKESYKAARILRSFCKDGVYEDEIEHTGDGPKQMQRVIKKIPAEVIRNAKGLAIFTTMRTGLWFSGAGGSGVLVARMEDGTWSPPSGILLHTAAIGFLVGVDIYDCVLVLNNQEAVTAFSKWRFTLGGEMSAVAGPVGIGGILDTEVNRRRAPIFTYLRSRGFYAGVQIDGTVIIERNDENETYYGYKYSATEILSGKVRHPPAELKMLSETLKAAQGDTDVDESALPVEPPPADFEVVKSDHVFGIPDREDPDPFGVLALEKEGFQIKEAGSQVIASSEEFEFKPNASSPIFEKYNRKSFDNSSKRNSWRSSSITINSTDRRYVTMDIATQTDFPEPPTPVALTPGITDISNPLVISTESRISETQRTDVTDNATQVRHREMLPPSVPKRNASPQPTTITAVAECVTSEDEGSSDEDEEEAVIIQEVHQAARPQMIVKPRMVHVPARPRPELPIRNPSRMGTLGAQNSYGDLQTSSENAREDETSTGSRRTSSSKENSVTQDTHASEESVTSTAPSQPSPISASIDHKAADTELKPTPMDLTEPTLVEVNLSPIIPDTKENAPTAAGFQEYKPSSPSILPPTQPTFSQTPWRPLSQRLNSPRTSLETVRSENKPELEQGQFKPFNQRFGSPRTSLDNGSRPSSQRFSFPRSSPRTSLEVIPQERPFSVAQKEDTAPISDSTLPRTSFENTPAFEHVTPEREPSPVSGPRISLASMKIRLDDDDDDDDFS